MHRLGNGRGVGKLKIKAAACCFKWAVIIAYMRSVASRASSPLMIRNSPNHAMIRPPSLSFSRNNRQSIPDPSYSTSLSLPTLPPFLSLCGPSPLATAGVLFISSLTQKRRSKSAAPNQQFPELPTGPVHASLVVSTTAVDPSTQGGTTRVRLTVSQIHGWPQFSWRTYE